MAASPPIRQAIFTTPSDAPLTYAFNQAAKYAERLNAQKFLGHDDWRVPTKGELNLLFRKRAAISGFVSRWYWTSEQNSRVAWAQRFTDGHQDFDDKRGGNSLRCVRG